MPAGVNLAVSILHILLAVILIVVILLQSSKRTGLSGSISGASETFFGKNQVKTIDKLLSMWTAICAIAFLITSLALAYGFALNKNATPSPSAQPSAQVSLAPIAPKVSVAPAVSSAPKGAVSAPATTAKP